jgi:hypothetical protein
MFVGHYGPSFAVQALRPAIPLWLLFSAVQLVDVAWAVLVLLGVEKVRIVPGITASNPLDLYYMPYTHSLVAATLWSVAAGVLVRLRPASGLGLQPCGSEPPFSRTGFWISSSIGQTCPLLTTR